MLVFVVLVTLALWLPWLHISLGYVTVGIEGPERGVTPGAPMWPWKPVTRATENHQQTMVTSIFYTSFAYISSLIYAKQI